MTNYDIMLQNAKKRFCTYDPRKLVEGIPAWLREGKICTCFLGEEVEVELGTGEISVGGRPANFCEALTIFDWLCDARPDASAAWEFCPITSLPGIFVRGSGLTMNFTALAEKFDQNPAAFAAAVENVSGKPLPLGDMGCQIMAFPNLPLQLKFYHADEDFPASITPLWDKNILQFIRYETIYYLAGCLRERLR